MKKKWNLREIMLKAWKIWRKGGVSFGEALHRAWVSAKAAPVNAQRIEDAKAAPVNAQRIEDAKAAAGIVEETNTWAGWKALGFEVIHGSKALFGADLVHAARGDGAIYKARFFGRSQVQPTV